MTDYIIEERTLKFTQEISIAPGVKIKSKDYALLHFNFDGHPLVGELATLPGFLPLELEELRQQLPLVTVKKESFYDLTLPYFNLFDGPLHSQVIFAFESALIGHLNKLHSLTRGNDSVESQQLLFSPISEIPHNQKALKVKIARESLVSDYSYIKEVRHKNPNARIRLDPNRELTTGEVTTLVELAHEQSIDGIEVSAAESLSLISSKLPLILDDNPILVEPGQLNRFKALVIKPTRDGGLSSAFHWHNIGYQVTLSSTYESMLGIESMILSAQIAGLAGAQGLGTQKFIQS